MSKARLIREITNLVTNKIVEAKEAQEDSNEMNKDDFTATIARGYFVVCMIGVLMGVGLLVACIFDVKARVNIKYYIVVGAFIAFFLIPGIFVLTYKLKVKGNVIIYRKFFIKHIVSFDDIVEVKRIVAGRNFDSKGKHQDGSETLIIKTKQRVKIKIDTTCYGYDLFKQRILDTVDKDKLIGFYLNDGRLEKDMTIDDFVVAESFKAINKTNGNKNIKIAIIITVVATLYCSWKAYLGEEDMIELAILIGLSGIIAILIMYCLQGNSERKLVIKGDKLIICTSSYQRTFNFSDIKSAKLIHMMSTALDAIEIDLNSYGKLSYNENAIGYGLLKKRLENEIGLEEWYQSNSERYQIEVDGDEKNMKKNQ